MKTVSVFVNIRKKNTNLHLKIINNDKFKNCV